MKRRSTHFKGYRYRRYAAALWLAAATWAILATTLIVVNHNDLDLILIGFAILFTGVATFVALALRTGHRANLEFAKVTPLLGVVRPLDQEYKQ